MCKPAQCHPAFQAVVQRFGSRRPVGDALALQQHPLVQSIEQWFGFGLPDAQPFVSTEIFDFPLDLVQLRNVRQRLLGNLTLVADMQVKELAPGVRHATDLGDGGTEAGLVATEVVTHQSTTPVAQKGSCMFTGAGFTEVVDHGLQIFKGSRRIGPEVGPVRLLIARLEHRHRGFISMQHDRLEHAGLQRINQWLQLHAANSHPLRQGGAGYWIAGPPKDGFLAVQRQMVSVLGHQHLCQQARCGQALVNDLCGHRRLRQGLALGARPLAAHVALHREHARCVVEFFADVFADAL